MKSFVYSSESFEFYLLAVKISKDSKPEQDVVIVTGSGIGPEVENPVMNLLQ